MRLFTAVYTLGFTLEFNAKSTQLLQRTKS